MEKQFISYALALKLKELGFNEPCLAVYNNMKESEPNKLVITKSWEGFIVVNRTVRENIIVEDNTYILAPLWQQAFDFFQERFKLSSSVQLKSVNHLGENYEIVIINFADFISEETTFRKDGFKTPLEAKNYCLNALIQFCS